MATGAEAERYEDRGPHVRLEKVEGGGSAEALCGDIRFCWESSMRSHPLCGRTLVPAAQYGPCFPVGRHESLAGS